MKICPFCSEAIQDEAVKCRYCKEFLKPDEIQKNKPPIDNFTGVLWGGFSAGFFILSVIFGSIRNPDSADSLLYNLFSGVTIILGIAGIIVTNRYLRENKKSIRTRLALALSYIPLFFWIIIVLSGLVKGINKVIQN